MTANPTTTPAAPASLRVSESDVAANRRRGGDMRVTLSPKTVGCTSGFGGTMRLPAGGYVSAHRHPYSEEFLHVVAGELRFTIDEVDYDLRDGDSALVPIDAPHRLVNTGDGEAHCVFHLSPLAPRPDLGHVDLEDLVEPDRPQLDVGGQP